MKKYYWSFGLLLAFALFADDPIYKSEVALSRVDVQVMDRNGRAISGLQVNDFVLHVDGKVVPIKNFDSESMPIDILLLLDVSGSMRPHVQRMADAAQEALNVLGPHDRIAIMVFDTRTRERLAFTDRKSDVTSELRHLVRWEGFNGGTRITSAMIDAANYVKQHARPDARRAVVILTDDQTQDSEDEPRVEAALSRANAVLSFLQAPYEEPMTRGRFPGGGGRGGGIGFPGGGGGWPGSGGGGIPGGGTIGYPREQDHTAGTDNIARDSGGDVMSINDTSSLEDTLARLRQRYALHFLLADESIAKSQHAIRVDLSTEARIRYADADVHSRRVFMGSGSDVSSGPTMVTHQNGLSDPIPGEDNSSPSMPPTSKRKHTAVNEDSSAPTINMDPQPPPN